MPAVTFPETILGSVLVAPAALLECNILLGLDDTGAFLKLIRRADNAPFFEYAFSDDMLRQWVRDLDTIRKQQHEAAKLAREETEREAAASLVLYFVRADGRCECPNCGATGSGEEVKEYGRVVCPCWMASAES